MAKTNKAMIWDGFDLKSVTWEGDSYEFLTNSVDGLIEVLRINDFGDNIDLWINEEGKFRDDFMPSAVLMYNGKVYDYTMGNIVFTGITKGGKTVSLTDDNIKTIEHYFDHADYYIKGAFALPVLHY